MPPKRAAVSGDPLDPTAKKRKSRSDSTSDLNSVISNICNPTQDGNTSSLLSQGAPWPFPWANVQGNDASDLQSALESVLPWPLLTALFQSSFVCKVQSTRMGFAKNGLTHFQFWTERHSFGPVSRPRRIWMGSQAFPGHHPLSMVGVKVRLNPRAVKTG